MNDKLLIDRATIAQVREALKASGCVAFEGIACRCNAPCSSYTADVALRAALAQQPEPAQEPVHQFRLMYSSDWHDGHPNPAYGYGPYQTRTLYTAPPQRKPLTDEEIDSIHINLSNTVGSSYKTLARAVERKVRGEA